MLRMFYTSHDTYFTLYMKSMIQIFYKYVTLPSQKAPSNYMIIRLWQNYITYKICFPTPVLSGSGNEGQHISCHRTYAISAYAPLAIYFIIVY